MPHVEKPDISAAEALAGLKKQLAENPQLKCAVENIDDDDYFLRYLDATDYDVAAAFEKLKNSYKLLLEEPQWMTRRAPMDYQEIIRKQVRAILPGKDREGRPIFLHKLENVDPSTMTPQDLVAVDDFFMEMTILKTKGEVCRTGLCVIMDTRNNHWQTMKWMTPHNLRVGLRKTQANPFRDITIHVVNDSSIMSVINKIVWPFLPTWIKESVRFHYNDRESLHKYIDPSSLPVEYGGTDTNVNYEELCEELLKNSDLIAESLSKFRELVPVT